jgi:hypothetical protein
MASDTAAIAQRGFAAFGSVAVQEAMLAFAPDFRRLILTFHFIIRLRAVATFFLGSDTPSGREPAIQSV